MKNRGLVPLEKAADFNAVRKQSSLTGFTLIELLIVIAIVAIISGALVPLFNVARQDAKIALVQAELDAIKVAAQSLHVDAGRGWWPAIGNTGDGLITDENAGIPIPGWEGPYLTEWKADPWGNFYMIRPIWPELWVKSFGPDGQSQQFNDPDSDDIWLLITSDSTK